MADNLTPEQRRRCMAAVRTRNTDLERRLAREMKLLGLRWSRRRRDLPGRPDFTFRRSQVAVFVDGDFWHGFRFPQWQSQLSPFWREKISTNRCRDKRVHRALRTMGWKVIRVWGHQVKFDALAAARRVLKVTQR